MPVSPFTTPFSHLVFRNGQSSPSFQAVNLTEAIIWIIGRNFRLFFVRKTSGNPCLAQSEYNQTLSFLKLFLKLFKKNYMVVLTNFEKPSAEIRSIWNLNIIRHRAFSLNWEFADAFIALPFRFNSFLRFKKEGKYISQTPNFGSLWIHTSNLSRTRRTLSVEQNFSCGAILLHMKIVDGHMEQNCFTWQAILLHMNKSF